jgi:hypothetical protein
MSVFWKSRPNSLVCQNIFVPKTWRGARRGSRWGARAAPAIRHFRVRVLSPQPRSQVSVGDSRRQERLRAAYQPFRSSREKVSGTKLFRETNEFGPACRKATFPSSSPLTPARQSRPPALNSWWSRKARRHAPFSRSCIVSIHGMRASNGDLGACLQGPFSTHGFCTCRKATHAVLTPVATEDGDRGRLE